MPSINSSQVLADDLDDLLRRNARLKQRAQEFAAALAVTAVPGLDIIQFAERLQLEKANLQTLAARPGLASFAQSNLELPGLDLAAEFTAMIAAIDAVLAWIAANYPVDGSGNLDLARISGGAVVWSTYTTGQTAGLQTVLTDLANAID